MLLSYLFAITIPLCFLYLIWALEIYSFSRGWLLMSAFGWGMVSFFIAFVVQDALIDHAILTYTQVTLFSAPVLEEFLKAAFLIALMQTFVVRYAVDGTSYGFAVGTGFAIAENLFYISIGTNNELSSTLIRVFSVSLMHAFASGVIGTVVGMSSLQSSRVRVPRITLAIVFSMIVHAIFNLVANGTQGALLIVIALIIGFSGTAILVMMIRHALTLENRAIERALTGSLSAGELAATLNPQQVAHIISAQTDALGTQRTERITRYITLQAQRGMLQKMQSMNQRSRYDAVLASKLETIEYQINALQGSMGMFSQMWLRRALPSEESTLWMSLDAHLNNEDALLNLLVELNQRRATMDTEALNIRRNVLEQSSLFSELSADDLVEIALMLNEEHYMTGETVIAQGSDTEKLYFVAQGAMIVSVIDDEESETIITTFVHGDHFGELSMIDGYPHPTQIVSVDDVLVYTLKRADFLTLTFANPMISLAMMRKLVSEIRQRTELITWIRQTEVAEHADVKTG